jgi:hypothetical protein
VDLAVERALVDAERTGGGEAVVAVARERLQDQPGLGRARGVADRRGRGGRDM